MKKSRSYSNKIRLSLLGIALIGLSSLAKAQFVSTSTPETIYPDVSMSPPSLNLVNTDTKFLSNFSYPGTGPLSGSTIELSGWSTDNDGGFAYGTSTAGTYTGIGAMTIPNVKEVQVGYMEFGSNSYIVAAYYDVKKLLYGYDLYSWDLVTNVIAKLYTYHFADPNFVMPAYTPTTDYYPVIGGSAPPPGGYPAPPTQSTMEYNRISMDISQGGNRIVMVLSDNLNGYMYTAVGMIALDTIRFSGSLPNASTTPAVSVAVITVPAPGTPTYHFPYPGAYTGGPTIYNYFDGATGIYAQYDLSTNKYLYSYYPIDLGVYITEYDATAGTIEQLLSTSTNLPYSPLIRLKAASSVTTPCVNPYYLQYWPDVAFQGENNMRYVFYTPELFDLYISNDDYLTSFMDMYSYTGGSWDGYGCTGEAGITDMMIGAFNTGDGRRIRETTTSWCCGYNFESRCESLPIPTGEELRAKIDAPDMASSMWGITFDYGHVPPVGYTVTYSPPPGPPPTPPTFTYIIHDPIENGKKNIYVRYNGFKQAIMNNGSMAHTASNLRANFAPTIAYKPLSSNASVAWVSEDAGRAMGGRWAYIGLEINTAVATGTTSPASLVTLPSYLYLSSNPGLDCGDYPLVALSKYTYGMTNLYSAFTQEDRKSVYSVQHKDHPWISTTFWKKTNLSGNQIAENGISVGPNPFSTSLHIQSAEVLELRLTDITGRTLAQYQGTAEDINKQLDAKASQLAAGNYLLHTQTLSGKQEVFKLSKQ